MGDARLSLEREPPQRFHVLALDAFSGDTIPIHLLTLEAMTAYVKHLVPEGVIAVHVSNRHLDLAPVVRGPAHRLGLKTLAVDYAARESDDEIGESSNWILCTRSEPALLELSPHATKSVDTREIVWTDNRSDLFSILRR